MKWFTSILIVLTFVCMFLSATVNTAFADRVPFYTVFQDSPNGSYSPKCVIRIGGITMGPGVSFTKGTKFAGIDIAANAGRDLEITENSDGSVTLEGIY